MEVHVDNRLRRLVRHAYERVPYYRAAFDDAGLNPADVRSVRDLAALPIATKADLQRDPDAFVAHGVDHSRLLERVTSGSTGQPSRIRNSPWDEFRRQVERWRVDIGYGVRPGDRRIRFKTPRPLLAGDRVLLDLLSAARLYQQRKIDSMMAADETVAVIAAFRPTIIDGMASSIDRAAQALLDRGDTSIRPRYVTTGAETLTPEMRRRITEAFQAPVYDVFGSCETGVMASECPRTGLYHVASGVVIEVLREDGSAATDGEVGEVVATSLLSRAVPVIRYATGDLVERGPDVCPCGRRVETLRAIRGRRVELFRLGDGRLVHSYEFPMRTALWIRRFQMAQRDPDRFEIRLIVAAGTSADEIDGLRHSVLDILGSGVGLEISIVDKIDVGPGGKEQPFHSLGVHAV